MDNPQKIIKTGHGVKAFLKGNLYLIIVLLVFPLELMGQEKAEDDLYNEKYRPQYHFSRKKGWMNDPSGLFYFQGQYHLYYWGHAVSSDLLHWEHRPRVLEGNEQIGAMSGSAVVDWNNTSGFGSPSDPPVVAVYSMLRHSDRRQMQGIAYSNDQGKTFTPWSGNPVIDIGSTSFRDPQVFWYEPDQKWVMVVALSGQRKVRFYASDNLKEWSHLSNFGPAGARQGVWECPDMFALPVDGDSTNMKWVLEVDVQPTGGQYFIGHFDGKTFRMDADFAADLKEKRSNAYIPQGEVLFDFEQEGLPGWQIQGKAFDESPAKGALARQNAVIGYKGERLINSFHQGDGTTGKIISPSFKIEKAFINFLYGGGNHPGQTCMNLLINGKVVRTQTGINTEALYWTGWDVSEFKGQEARLEIVDQHTGGFGHITIDHIIQSNKLARHQREKAFWIDYGPDFYAVRSWVNYPKDSERRVWIAWLSNWLYANDVPTEPWKGFQSIPRELKLTSFPEGIRLTQKPIRELKDLRKERWSLNSQSIQGTREIEFDPKRNTYEIMAEFNPGQSNHFGFKICKDEDQQTIVGYDVSEQMLYVDRRNSGKVDFHRKFPRVSEGLLKSQDGNIRLHILVDQSSVEVFGNKGQTVISSQIFPAPRATDIELFSEGGSVRLLKMEAWPLESVWKRYQ
jgi:sucrose-6-phosphate hydrolase SacC (GH32 family)